MANSNLFYFLVPNQKCFIDISRSKTNIVSLLRWVGFVCESAGSMVELGTCSCPKQSVATGQANGIILLSLERPVGL